MRETNLVVSKEILNHRGEKQMAFYNYYGFAKIFKSIWGTQEFCRHKSNVYIDRDYTLLENGKNELLSNLI